VALLLVAAWFAKAWDPSKHPRGPDGRFIRKLTAAVDLPEPRRTGRGRAAPADEPASPAQSIRPRVLAAARRMTNAELLQELETRDWNSERFRAAFLVVTERDSTLVEKADRLLEEREERERRIEEARANEEYLRDLTRQILARRGDMNAMRYLRNEYLAWVQEQMIAAEAETMGYFVNERGRRAGVSALRVWTSERDFERYASRELQDYRAAHPEAWKTFRDWRAQYAPVLSPGRRRSSRRSPDTPRDQALPGLTGRPIRGRRMVA
jgi:NADH dehydrogenase/NADH:ubiquinone oxidoreductase subunit G